MDSSNAAQTQTKRQLRHAEREQHRKEREQRRKERGLERQKMSTRSGSDFASDLIEVISQGALALVDDITTVVRDQVKHRGEGAVSPKKEVKA